MDNEKWRNNNKIWEIVKKTFPIFKLYKALALCPEVRNTLL